MLLIATTDYFICNHRFFIFSVDEIKAENILFVSQLKRLLMVVVAFSIMISTAYSFNLS